MQVLEIVFYAFVIAACLIAVAVMILENKKRKEE